MGSQFIDLNSVAPTCAVVPLHSISMVPAGSFGSLGRLGGPGGGAQCGLFVPWVFLGGSCGPRDLV